MDAPATAKAGPQNVVELLLQWEQRASQVGATHKVDGRWEDVTWGKLIEDVKALSAGLVSLGVKPGDRVAIFANTSLQWILCDVAISAAQAIGVPIYASNTPEECRYILDNSESVFVFVDNDEGDAKQPGRMTRVRQRLGDLPNVRKVILFSGEVSGDREMLLKDLIEQGRAAHQANPAAFDERVRAVKSTDHCHFIYTSGTTGNPKGVMLTHGNWTYQAQAVGAIQMMEPNDTVFLFLPLAHSFGQVVKAAWLGLGFRLIVDGAVDKLLVNLTESRPSVLPAVPRVFEKVYNNVVANGTAAPGLKGKLARWAFRLFDEYVEARKQGREYSSLGFTLARKLVFSKVRATLDEKLGGNMRLFISGGAPLSPKIAYFFDLLGYKVVEGYGLTETSAPAAANLPHKIKIGTVGPPMPGSEAKIAPDGEILVRGPYVMTGYYKNPEATKEALDEDGWFHTGDIGELDADNYIRITDRKKDIIVTAGGKNVAPQNIENTLKTFPLISQAMVYGDQRPYLVVLITVAEDSARKLLEEKGAPVGTYAENARRPEVYAAVQDIINKVNADQPPYATMKKFAIMEADFTQETGELTPTLKVKRKFCGQKYAAIIEKLYEGGKSSAA